MIVHAYRSSWWDGDDGFGIAGGSEAILRQQRGDLYADSYMTGWRDGRNNRLCIMQISGSVYPTTIMFVHFVMLAPLS